MMASFDSTFFFSFRSRLASFLGAGFAAFIAVALKNVLHHFYFCDSDSKNLKLLSKALNSVPFYLSTMIILLGITSNRGICQRVDVGELSHPAMHKRLFKTGNAVDDEAKVFGND